MEVADAQVQDADPLGQVRLRREPQVLARCGNSCEGGA
jgi:hypothetical protein